MTGWAAPHIVEGPGRPGCASKLVGMTADGPSLRPYSRAPHAGLTARPGGGFQAGLQEVFFVADRVTSAVLPAGSVAVAE